MSVLFEMSDIERRKVSEVNKILVVTDIDDLITVESDMLPRSSDLEYPNEEDEI